MSISNFIKAGVPVAGIGLIIFMAFNLQCKNPVEKNEQQEVQYASLDPHNNYVGMESCRDCHQSIYDTYIETGMGKSFDLASKSKSSGNFSGHQAVYDKHFDFWYKPYWSNDSLFIMEYRLDGKDTSHKRIEAVSYIVGSGQHTNSHIMNTFGYLNQMPLTYYTQKGTWDLPPGFENGGNKRFSRQIGLECISCHNAYPVFLEGSENRYDFVDNGIDCERCHGPGEKHVIEKRSGKVVDVVTGIDYTIVNPAKLPIDLQLDVCQRCHIQGNAVLNDDKSFFDFRPGMRLTDVMNVFMPVYRGGENDHIMASHVERMKLSRCFTETVKRAPAQSKDNLRPYKNAMTCITCHNPHVSVQKTDKDHFNKACNSCHSSNADGVCSEKKEVLALKNFNCVSCHMPESGAIDIPHVSVHDHYIRKPVDETEINNIKQFIGINCINNPDAGNEIRGKAFIAYYEKFNFGIEVLDSAKKYFPYNTKELLFKNFESLVHIAFLEKNYRAIIEYTKSIQGVETEFNKQSFDNSNAWTAYRIGEAYNEVGDYASAVIYFKKSYLLASYVSEFANKYATALVLINEYKDARKILEYSARLYPKFAPVLSNLGYLVLVMENDTARANTLYNKALALDPDYEQAIINKAGLLMVTGKKNDALKLLTGYLKRRPNSIKAKELLVQIKNA